MARIRTVKPEFWSDEKLAECSVGARLLFIGTWNFADDEGRMEYSPKRLKMQIFPGDSIGVAALVTELAQAGLVTLYRVADRDYMEIPNFKKHQRVDHPRPSTIPAPTQEHSVNLLRSFPESSAKAPRPLPDASANAPRALAPEGNGMEGNGTEEAKAKAFAPESGARLTLCEAAGETWAEIQRSSPTEDQVERLYQLFPLKVGKIAAKKALRKATAQVMHGDADHPPMPLAEALDYLADRLRLYGRCVQGRDRKYIPHPATWFNEGRFWDDEQTWKVGDSKNGVPKTPTRLANPVDQLRAAVGLGRGNA
jgi:hypothetical protein